MTQPPAAARDVITRDAFMQAIAELVSEVAELEGEPGALAGGT